MARFAATDISQALKSAPIDPSWIEAGTPQARNQVLFLASDKSAWTMLWDCTAGEFRWRYHMDETIHFLDGEVTITLEGGTPRTYGPGDVIFFPAGAVAHWKVDRYIRKLAFCQIPAPRFLRPLLAVARRLGKLSRDIKRRRAAPQGQRPAALARADAHPRQPAR